jgi:flavin-dependent thymidylate synthase
LTDHGWLKLKDAIDTGAMFLSSDRAQVDLSNSQIPIIDESKEEWRPVAEYEGRYDVSNMGRVRSWLAPGGCENVTVLTAARIKNPTTDHRGYLIVSLSKHSDTLVRSIHQLVLETFVGPCPEDQEARHTNHNRLDCRLDNLSYGTCQDNSNDRMRSGCDQTLVPTFFHPVSWRWDGEEMTYDLSVEGPHHNFFAGGMVVHNSVNEYSTRYSEAISEKQTTLPSEWRSQSKSNKQGSGGFIQPDNLPELGQLWLATEQASANASGEEPQSPGQYLSDQEERLHTHINEVYRQRLGFGVAREQARKDLSLSTYTEAYWKIDLHNLFHFLGLRMDGHAQKEIRDYAWTIGEEIVSKVVPVAWEAFRDYHFDSVHLTRLDCEVMKSLSNGFRLPISEDDFLTIQHAKWSGLERCRERDECLEKLRRLGMVV